ncbi:hypothetical protein HPB50_007569 [Hyalomma asiaticum]|uniref:Uncharacterized protein n=1 Tax=Hyalomma asiaticum TaxID=266040 RepID=A0ACB7TK45_HYAAI|nr:hypothetical protein HPB50_007569 [Hyalomma asiaticum]
MRAPGGVSLCPTTRRRPPKHNVAIPESHGNGATRRLVGSHSHSLLVGGHRNFLKAGIQPLFMPPEKSQLFTNAKKAITVDPIPRNVHPTHNEGRRKARAKAILAKIKHNETKFLFVDAARYWNRGSYAVSVVDTHGSLVNAATVLTNFTHEAEEMAIAVALRSCTGASVIYSDSRTAIRTFSAALVSSKAAAIVNTLLPRKGRTKFSVLTHRMVPGSHRKHFRTS